MNSVQSAPPFNIVLGSASPRRQFLLTEVGIAISVRLSHADESFPPDIKAKKLPVWLAKKKAEALEITRHELLITADTIVVRDAQILNKPANEKEAFDMLKSLSGRTHTVITGVCFTTLEKQLSFDEYTRVTFHKLNKEDIKKYIRDFKPFDKAGSYGAQDCLPPGLNPCSPEEMEFLKQIGKPDLAEKSFTKKTGEGLMAISKIEGSYFNVMGLPVHKVYKQLETIFS